MVNIFIDNKLELKFVEYIVDEFFRYININYKFVSDINNAHIVYTFDSHHLDDCIVIRASKKFWYHFKELSSLPDIPLYKDKDNQSYIYEEDIFASAFFLLSGYEEFLNKKRDTFDRFLYQYSHYLGEDVYKLPYVEIYRDILIRQLNDIGILCKRINVWNGELGTFITHDVDGVYKYRSTIKSLAKIFLKPNKFKFNELIRSKINIKSDPYFNGFYRLLDAAENFNFKTTFFLITSSTCKLDDFYRFHDKPISNIINVIRYRRSEIGLHGSLASYNDKEKLMSEKKLLSKSHGIRQHYLKYDINCTSSIHNSCFGYDTSLGFADMIGFRRGTCLPFKIFDLANEKSLEIFEFPLLLMDQTLKSYMLLNMSEALDKAIELIDIVKKYHGLFTVLWHPGNCSDEWTEWFSYVYLGILEYLKKCQCESLLGQDILSRMENA